MNLVDGLPLIHAVKTLQPRNLRAVSMMGRAVLQKGGHSVDDLNNADLSEGDVGFSDVWPTCMQIEREQ